jgi:hypothetical protein
MITIEQAEEARLALQAALDKDPTIEFAKVKIIWSEGTLDSYYVRTVCSAAALTLTHVAHVFSLIIEHLGDFYRPRVHVSNVSLEFDLDFQDAIPIA